MSSYANDPRRRTVKFETLDDVLQDAEAIMSGNPTCIANWTPAQNVDHIRRLMTCARSGFPDIKVAWPLRILGKLIKGHVQKSPPPAGRVKLPPAFEEAFVPPPSITPEEALANLREEIKLSTPPGSFKHPSPFFGELSHDEWTRIQLRHAELHMSFIVPKEQA